MEYQTRKGFNRNGTVQMLKGAMAVAKKGHRLLLIAILIGTSFYLYWGNSFAADTWYRAFSRPFLEGSYGENQVRAMAEFGGTIYVGTGQTEANVSSASIYRLTACNFWESFTPPWSSSTGSGSEPFSMAMLVFNDHLYVGTDQGEVWQTDGKKWTNWKNVTGNWSKGDIIDMAEFDGYLYIIFHQDKNVWRTKDGSSWKQVADNETFWAIDPHTWSLDSLEAFGDYLYAGTARKKQEEIWYVAAIALWRMDKNLKWDMFHKIDFHSTQKPCEKARALKAFKNYLYLGQYHGSGLYQTDGTSWEAIDANLVGQGVHRLEEHDNKLVSGMSNFTGMTGWVGSPLLFWSQKPEDPTQWTEVPGGLVVGSDAVTIGSLLSSKERLYVGYWNCLSQSGDLAIDALGPCPTPCRVRDIGKGVGVVTGTIKNIIAPVRIYPHLPPFQVLPPIGPKPPHPNGDELFEWEFLMVTDIIGAVSQLEVSPEVEEMKELVLQDLEMVNAEVGLAMSMLYEATCGGDDHVRDEVLSRLDNALGLCREVSILLCSMQGECICDVNYDGICDEQDLTIFGESHGWGDWDCNEPGVDCLCDIVTDENGTCDALDGAAFREAYSRSECRLEDEPEVYTLIPDSISASQPGSPQKVKIKGLNFGATQGSSSLHIGGKTWFAGHPKIKIWEDSKIKFKVPNYGGSFPKFKDVWVTVNGKDSNKVQLTITAP